MNYKDDEDDTEMARSLNKLDIQNEKSASHKIETNEELHGYSDFGIRNGECIILDYQKYEETLRMPTRLESKHDAKWLQHCFQELEFHVETHLNLTKSETCHVLNIASQRDHAKDKYFVCCILTHGRHEELCTYNGYLNIKEFLTPFLPINCPSLAGKPKIFIIQACRGRGTEQSVSVESPDNLPDVRDQIASQTDSNQMIMLDFYGSFYFETDLYVDYLIANSTYPGNYSFKRRGRTIFIVELCYAMEQFSKILDLVQILTVVNFRIAWFFESVHLEKELNGNKQMPSFSSGLRTRIQFHKSITPFQSYNRTFIVEKRIQHRLNEEGTQWYKIRKPENVQFFSIVIKKGYMDDDIKETEASLAVHLKAKGYYCELPKYDIKRSVIKASLESFAGKDYSDFDGLICFIATYSNGQIIHDLDGRKIEKKDIVKKFLGNNCPSLIGKPKIFIFLMCPIAEVQIYVSRTSTDGAPLSIPVHADILEITISVYDKEMLNKSMQEFGQILTNSENLLDALTTFNSELVKEYGFDGRAWRSPVSISSTLTKNLYLP